MKNKNRSNKIIDSLPDTFTSEEDAGEFWDTHSTTDYEEYLEPVDMTVDIVGTRNRPTLLAHLIF